MPWVHGRKRSWANSTMKTVFELSPGRQRALAGVLGEDVWPVGAASLKTPRLNLSPLCVHPWLLAPPWCFTSVTYCYLSFICVSLLVCELQEGKDSSAVWPVFPMPGM